jgi:hypothetical protein
MLRSSRTISTPIERPPWERSHGLRGATGHLESLCSPPIALDPEMSVSRHTETFERKGARRAHGFVLFFVPNFYN